MLLIAKSSDESSAESLQRDIYSDMFINWPRECLMKLNSNDCKVMHFGNKNVWSDYFIDDLSIVQIIDSADSRLSYQKVLEVFVSEDFKCSKHLSKIAPKESKILGLLVKNFDN